MLGRLPQERKWFVGPRKTFLHVATAIMAEQSGRSTVSDWERRLPADVQLWVLADSIDRQRR